MAPPPENLLREWPERLPGYLWVPDDDLKRFPKWTHPPEGIVWHSGAIGRRLGEYSTDEPDGRCIAYHFPWFDSLEGFCQTVPLTVRAYHAGKQGNMWIGAGLPGPETTDPRPDHEKNECQTLAVALMQAFPGVLRYWCRHSDLTRNRRDPGPGVKDSWFEEIGLTHRKPA